MPIQLIIGLTMAQVALLMFAWGLGHWHGQRQYRRWLDAYYRENPLELHRTAEAMREWELRDSE